MKRGAGPALRVRDRGAPSLAVVGFAGGIAFVFVLALLGVRGAREANDAVALVEHTHVIIESLSDVSARLGEARSARRAYGLTGDITHRQTFEAAATSVPERIASIRELTRDSPTQQRRVTELEPLVDDRLGRLRAQLAIREATGQDPRLDDAQSLANGLLDDAIRRVLSDMTIDERNLLAVREEASHARFSQSQSVSAVSASFAILLLFMAFWLVIREARQRKLAEAATLRALAEAKTLNSELESFSYSVSHDLRAPLRAIDGFSQAILEDSAHVLDDVSKTHLSRVRVATQRMGQLIDDILGLARVAREKVAVEDADLTAIARASIDDLLEANRERKIEVTIAPNLVDHADSRLLRVAFDNLLGNAFKFTAKRALAHIDVGMRDEDGEVTYYVRDDGVGFDARYADKLFGAFQRLHDARDFPGTGIGLATVQRIIRRHGGRLWAESEVGRGATFFFTLHPQQRSQETE